MAKRLTAARRAEIQDEALDMLRRDWNWTPRDEMEGLAEVFVGWLIEAYGSEASDRVLGQIVDEAFKRFGLSQYRDMFVI